MTDRPGCVALVVAGGRGDRFGGEVPKQYRRVAGAALLRWAVLPFLDHRDVDAVRVVLRPEDRDLYAEATAGLDLLEPVPGGATRQQSVLRGLESLADLAPATVLIHDAARPFVTGEIISRVLAALSAHAGAVAAVPVRDTLKQARGEDGGTVSATVDRRRLWRAQTPQGFRFPAILAAHRSAAREDLTDDAAVAERAGLDVALATGSEDNFKITTEDDLLRAERLVMADAEVRTGLGFDVHRFEPGDRLVLCGIEIPFRAGLKGHSDADVALHALTDALLGCIGAADIGDHFPPSDARWRGVASELFLRHAAGLVARAGGRIVNVDLTLICERPKIAAHRPAMVSRVAAILGIEPARVNIKGTTTEGLGFTGREEGIAAQAVATVALAKLMKQ